MMPPLRLLATPPPPPPPATLPWVYPLAILVAVGGVVVCVWLTWSEWRKWRARLPLDEAARRLGRPESELREAIDRGLLCAPRQYLIAGERRVSLDETRLALRGLVELREIYADVLRAQEEMQARVHAAISDIAEHLEAARRFYASQVALHQETYEYFTRLFTAQFGGAATAEWPATKAGRATLPSEVVQALKTLELPLEPDGSGGLTFEQARAQYRKLARASHPDTGGETADAQRFIAVNAAYQTLVKWLTSADEQQCQGPPSGQPPRR